MNSSFKKFFESIGLHHSGMHSHWGDMYLSFLLKRNDAGDEQSQ
ncbi:hypothetical protein [Echinicola pacifica]|nr:hypothetical protein [Echinicola pacifica]